MNNLTFHGKLGDEFLVLQRISKKRANSLLNQGDRIFIQTCKFHPFGVWTKATELTNELGFHSQIASFEYYNCNFETGYYSSFYQILKP